MESQNPNESRESPALRKSDFKAQGAGLDSVALTPQSNAKEKAQTGTPSFKSDPAKLIEKLMKKVTILMGIIVSQDELCHMMTEFFSEAIQEMKDAKLNLQSMKCFKQISSKSSLGQMGQHLHQLRWLERSVQQELSSTTILGTFRSQILAISKQSELAPIAEKVTQPQSEPKRRQNSKVDARFAKLFLAYNDQRKGSQSKASNLNLELKPCTSFGQRRLTMQSNLSGQHDSQQSLLYNLKSPSNQSCLFSMEKSNQGGSEDEKESVYGLSLSQSSQSMREKPSELKREEPKPLIIRKFGSSKKRVAKLQKSPTAGTGEQHIQDHMSQQTRDSAYDSTADKKVIRISSKDKIDPMKVQKQLSAIMKTVKRQGQESGEKREHSNRNARILIRKKSEHLLKVVN